MPVFKALLCRIERIFEDRCRALSTLQQPLGLLPPPRTFHNVSTDNAGDQEFFEVLGAIAMQVKGKTVCRPFKFRSWCELLGRLEVKFRSWCSGLARDSGKEWAYFRSDTIMGFVLEAWFLNAGQRKKLSDASPSEPQSKVWPLPIAPIWLLEVRLYPPPQVSSQKRPSPLWTQVPWDTFQGQSWKCCP